MNEKKPPALVFITESWHSENDPLETFCIESYYQLKSKPRKSLIRGGVAFYARCDLEYEILEFETKLECAIKNAKIDDLNIKNFCVIYRPDTLKFIVFMELLEELMIHSSTLKNDCIMFVDFNVDTLTNDYEKHQYTNMLTAYGFVVQNNSPTRATSTTATCLNLVISSYHIETEKLKITISNHFAP